MSNSGQLVRKQLKKLTPSAPTVKYWCTKYALTGGIKEFTPMKFSSNPQYVYSGPFTLVKIGTDAFETREEAVVDANKRLVKKMAALQKQILKLEKITF
jgi:hypothetical protein